MRRLIPTLAALALLAGLIALFRVAQRFDPTARYGPGYQEAGLGDISVRFEKAVIISRSEGRRQWILHADRVDLRRTAGGGLDAFRTVDFYDIHDGVFYREGRPEAFFAARQAVFDQAAHRFDVHGGIHVRSVKGDTLESDEMVWTERDHFTHFPTGAKGVFRGQSVSAPNLLYSARDRTVQCPQGASGRFDGYPLEASALFWDVERGRVRCFGRVSGQRRSMDFTAQGADFDLKKHTFTANKVQLRLRIEGENAEGEELP